MSRKNAAKPRGVGLAKATIEGLSGDQVNDLVTDQVMGFVRMGRIVRPGLEIPPSWADKKGSTSVPTGSGTNVNAPNYELRLMPGETPDYMTEEWHSKLVAKMIRRGFKMELFQVAETFSAAFYVPPALPVPIVASDDKDAVRRAALLAVQ
jgi:hypothetical protein